MNEINEIADPIDENLPKDWLPEQKSLASDAMRVLHKHYPGWKWGIEWTEIVGKPTGLGAMLIKILNMPTDLTFIFQYEDIDRDNMRSVMRAGGQFLEALGVSRAKNRHDEIQGMARSPGGLIIPFHEAIPDNNPGKNKIKKLAERAEEKKKSSRNRN